MAIGSFDNPTAGNNGELVIPQIISPNFSITDETGWALLQNGTLYAYEIVLPGGTTTHIFFASSAPVADEVGDLWYDTSNGLLLHQWNGTSWVPYQISSGAIATGGIEGTNIASATITGTNIASGTITGTNIDSATITGSNIASGTIAGSNIESGTITGSNIASATIAGSNIESGTITAGNITNATITATQIASGTITGTNIASATIDASNIANATITETQIANGTITTTQISNSADITGTQIASGTVAGSNIAAGTITASNIASGTITATQIAANTIDVGNLAAGIVYAGIVDGTTITGGSLVADGAAGNVLVYSGTPETGNLVGSWSALAGTDTYGNTYPAGLSVLQGQITGVGITNTTITNSTFQGDILTDSTLSGASLLGGSILEADIQFDTGGGNLLNYTSTTSTITENSNGTYTWTVPSNVTSAKVECWGAGAGGNGGSTSVGGNGGGGGEYAQEPFYPVVPGNTYTYVVGNGGNGGTTGTGAGISGGASFFDNTGVVANGGQASTTGGTGSTNTIHHNGGNGGGAGLATGGASGGNSGNSTASGNNGNAPSGSTGGAAPSSQSGSGTGGAGGNSGANGSNGGNPGAGGGGAGKGTTSSGTLSKSYSPTWVAGYYGPDATFNANDLESTSTMYQGGTTVGGGAANGNRRSMMRFNSSAIASDFSGYTITGCTVTLTNQYSYNDSGMSFEIDYATSTLPSSAPSTFTATFSQIAIGTIAQGATHTYSLGSSVGARFAANTCNGLGLGYNVHTNEPYNVAYYGWFTSAVTLTITGTQSMSGNNTAGNGTDGQVKITYTSGTTLTAAISPTGGTDQYSNTYYSGISAENVSLFAPPSTPPAPASGIAVLYVDNNGAVAYTDGAESQAYKTGRRTLYLTSGSGNVTTSWSTFSSGSTIFSSTVDVINAPRAYRIHGIMYANATSGAEFAMGIQLPSSATTGQFYFYILRSTTFSGAVAGAPGSIVGDTTSLGTAVYPVSFDGMFTISSSGTMNILAGSLTSTAFSVNQYSFIDIMPL